MERIGFVIVQYNNDNDTIQCVASIKKTMKKNDYHICIVDNHSLNDAYYNIIDEYIGDKQITIIKSEENLGYAKGANTGVKTLLDRYDAELVCVLNNDILFNVSDLQNLINKIEEPYDLLAPNIYQKDGISQNPQPEIKYNLVWINLYLMAYQFLAILNRVRLDIVLYTFAVFMMSKIYAKGKKSPSERRYISKLHGSCMFFTRSYLEESNRDAMHPGTFLFLEEDFIALRCKKEKKKILFNHEIHVIHLEDQSTNLIYKNSRKKRMFLYKNHIQSFKEFKNYYMKIQN